jgi:hypothetical protein
LALDRQSSKGVGATVGDRWIRLRGLEGLRGSAALSKITLLFLSFSDFDKLFVVLLDFGGLPSGGRANG